MTPLFPKDRLLTAEEVAQILGIKCSTISKWVYEKKIPFIKFGPGKKSIVKFNPGRLNRWLEENSYEPGTEEDSFVKNLPLKKTGKKTTQRFDQFAKEIISE